jgi:FeS assembly SUF system protein
MNRPEHLANVDFSAIDGMAPDALDQRAGVGRTGDPQIEQLRLGIISSLRQVYDPELPVNIYDLGLVYRLDISPEGDIEIDMTLTAPACPVAGIMPAMVKSAITELDGIGCVDVQLVWDPPWSPEQISEAVKLDLNLL